MTFHPRHARRSLARAGAPDGWAKAATHRAAIGCCRPARKMRAGSNLLTLPAPDLQARRVEGADRARNRAAPPRPSIPTARPRWRRPWARKAAKAIRPDRPTIRKDRSALPRTHPTARPASAPPS